MAYALEKLGDRGRAEKMYRMAVAIDEATYGAKHPQTLADQKALGEFFRRR